MYIGYQPFLRYTLQFAGCSLTGFDNMGDGDSGDGKSGASYMIIIYEDYI
jgi:hypothetical protein